MLAKDKSSGNICISNSMPFLPSDLSANVQKPENVVNRPIDGQTDGQTDGQKSGRGALLLWPPQLGLGRKCDKKWKFKNVEKITSFSDAVTLTFDLRPWKVNQVRTLSLPMCIPNLRTIQQWFFSYRVNTIVGGGRLRRKTITSPDPSDTGDIIIIIIIIIIMGRMAYILNRWWPYVRSGLLPNITGYASQWGLSCCVALDEPFFNLASLGECTRGLPI